jgi:hypothetical protein
MTIIQVKTNYRTLNAGIIKLNELNVEEFRILRYCFYFSTMIQKTHVLIEVDKKLYI